MPSPLRTGPRLTAVALAGVVLLSGCGLFKDDDAASPTPSATSSAGGSPPAQAPRKPAGTVYHDPMDVARKIRKAGLGCQRPKRTESLGSGKVICSGAHDISIEFYETTRAFAAVKKAICQMGMVNTIVADTGQRWMVTTNSTTMNRRVQRAVGGRVVKVC